MQYSKVLQLIRQYISVEILRGNVTELDKHTPLLEWGIIKSLELTAVLTFIQDQFDVQIDQEKIVAENFKDLDSIANLVLNLAEEQSISKTTVILNK